MTPVHIVEGIATILVGILAGQMIAIPIKEWMVRRANRGDGPDDPA